MENPKSNSSSAIQSQTSDKIIPDNRESASSSKVDKNIIHRFGVVIIGMFIILAFLSISAFFYFNNKGEKKVTSWEKPINDISKNDTGFDNQSDKKKEESKLPSCEGNEYFTVSPVSLDQFAGIIPLGELGPGGHNFPTEFIMFGMKRNPSGQFEGATIYSPGDIYITKINGGKVISGGGGTGYGIEFAACRELIGGMGLTSLSDRLLKEFVEPFDFCQEHTVGQESTNTRMTYNLCEKSGLMIKVKKGEIVGGIDDAAKNTLNFGTHDLRIEPLSFANQGRWTQKVLYATCPLDYFSPDLKTQLKSRLGNIYGENRRTKEPICGEVEQDVPGTAQGVWFVEGTPVDPMLADQSKHLALVHDNIDPTKPEFVVGSSQKDIESRKFFFNPENSGFVNRDFGDVIPGEIYCFDNLTNIHGDQPHGISILLRMPDETTLHMGKNSMNSCGSGPWEFGDYTVYKR